MRQEDKQLYQAKEGQVSAGGGSWIGGTERSPQELRENTGRFGVFCVASEGQDSRSSRGLGLPSPW